MVTISILVALLLGSALANVLLFRKAIEFYAREQSARLTPVDFKYAEANAKLLAEPKTKKRVIIFGESRCSMWYSNHPQNWGDLQIVNRGIPGESTEQIKARLQADVLALDPDLVILQMGDNDLKAMAVLEGTGEQLRKKTFENIVSIASSIHDSGSPVIITTIFPTGPIGMMRRPLWSDEVTQSIDEVNRRLLKHESPNVTVVDCDAFLRDGTYIKSEYAMDTLHLTPAGYQALNTALEPIVRELLD